VTTGSDGLSFRLVVRRFMVAVSCIYSTTTSSIALLPCWRVVDGIMDDCIHCMRHCIGTTYETELPSTVKMAAVIRPSVISGFDGGRRRFLKDPEMTTCRECQKIQKWPHVRC
jgi:hypothetical protein